jgi:hypothetical protein
VADLLIYWRSDLNRSRTLPHPCCAASAGDGFRRRCQASATALRTERKSAGRTRPCPDQPQPRRVAALVGGRPAQASGRESFSLARGRRGADGGAVAPVRREDRPRNLRGRRGLKAARRGPRLTPAARSPVPIRRGRPGRRLRQAHGLVRPRCARASRQCHVR